MEIHKKHTQDLVIDSSCKLIQVVETNIENLVGQKIEKLDLNKKHKEIQMKTSQSSSPMKK